MSEYDFTLKYVLPDTNVDPETFVGALLEAGCDDAIVGIGSAGRISLNFTREAVSAAEAVFSAMENIKEAIPGAKLVEAMPDFVGLTDVADMLGFSRQNMRKIVIKYGALFPPPAHEGKSSFWHLSRILDWLAENQQYHIDKSLHELAKINMALNITLEHQSIDPNLEKRARYLCA